MSFLTKIIKIIKSIKPIQIKNEAKNLSLPLCPCGSEELYEECCYKKKGADGEPSFFKGAMTSDDAGVSWHPLPKARLVATAVVQAVDKYREYAKELVIKSKLADKHHKDFINLYGLFYYSYEQLLKTLRTPSGKGVAFQTDKIEARDHWKKFLLNGRILLDFIGLHSREVLELNQDIGGLNEKKFNLILSILENKSVNNKKFIEIKEKLEALKNNIIDFINFRDKEKSPQDSIVKFPVVDYEYGVIKNGEVSLNGNNFNIIEFIESSYDSIYKLTLILLRIDISAK